MKKIANASLLGLAIGSVGVAAYVDSSERFVRLSVPYLPTSSQCTPLYGACEDACEAQHCSIDEDIDDGIDFYGKVIDYTKTQPYEESGQ